MKNLITLILLFLFFTSYSQDAKEILKRSHEKCKSIKQGYYEYESDFKFYDNEEGRKSKYRTYFKKNKKDLIYSFYFNNESDYKDTLRSIEVYNGDTQIRSFTYKNEGKIMTVNKDSLDILSYKHNLHFFNPILHRKNYPLYLFNNEKAYNIEYIKLDKMNGSICYNLRINEIIKPKKEDFRILKHELILWIDTSSLLPVYYTEEYISPMGKDTQTQFEKVTLHKLETNITIHDSVFNIKSIPDSFELKNYEKYVRPKLLEKDSNFPDFKYINLNGDSIQLSSLKGKVVLIDFFYKSCFPCVLALPHIQELHKKYKDKGLVVLGIDPYDKKDVIQPFMETQNITYDVLLGNGKEIRDNYHVSGYPTIYILNKKGEIVLAKSGYGPGMEKKYKKAIKKALKED